ncbi:MAG: ISAs1 family transposase [Anaerolineales bacterium]|nr:ISAs1 family transposase [Anaerolineales bacterium]
MRKQDEAGNEYLLSVYDIEPGNVMAQVEVGRQKNEITNALQALKMVEISRKVITGDTLHTQRGLAAQSLEAQGEYVLPVKENQPQLYKNIQALCARDYPKPGFGKIQTDFLTAQKVNTGHGRIERRSITTSEMLTGYSTWAGSGTGRSTGTPLSMAAQCPLLPYFLRHGIRHRQPHAQTWLALAIIAYSPSPLGH